MKAWYCPFFFFFFLEILNMSSVNALSIFTGNICHGTISSLSAGYHRSFGVGPPRLTQTASLSKVSSLGQAIFRSVHGPMVAWVSVYLFPSTAKLSTFSFSRLRIRRLKQFCHSLPISLASFLSCELPHLTEKWLSASWLVRPVSHSKVISDARESSATAPN